MPERVQDIFERKCLRVVMPFLFGLHSPLLENLRENMTNIQILAYYAGVLITSSIIFLVLRAVSIVYLERKQKRIFLKQNPNATPIEVEEDFKQYFNGFRKKLYALLGVVVVLIYIIFSK